MSYVDGFVLVVPKKKIAAYAKIARLAGKVWREHGALDYRECVGDDLKVKFGVPFTKLAKTKPDETIVFAYILYKSRAHRDRVNAKSWPIRGCRRRRRTCRSIRGAWPIAASRPSSLPSAARLGSKRSVHVGCHG